MTTPVEPKVEYGQYAWLTFIGMAAAVARIRRWTDDNGKFNFRVLAQEFAGAVVFGQMALALCAYENWSERVAGGLTGAMGLLGAVAVSAIVQGVISLRTGGKGNASDSKAS